ncbi:MAG: ribonuclease T2 family protein [Notoacmeibacter sp.]
MGKRCQYIVLGLLCLAVALFNFYGANESAFQNNKSGNQVSRTSDFDFYVLSLSWSPSFCVEEGGDEDREQCGTGRPYAFVVHGLWPQNERGFPASCESEFGTRIDREIADNMLDIMPSRGLVFHQWRKHGTCSGLSPDAFFDLTRKARQQINVPAEYVRLPDYKTVAPSDVETAFTRANPSLQQNAIAVTCSNRYLKEVRICMDRNLKFRPCPEVDSKSCRAAKTVMPPVRG